MNRTTVLLVAFATVFTTVLSAPASADITFENENFKIVIADDASWKSITDKFTGRQLCPTNDKKPFAAIYDQQSKYHPANSIRRNGRYVLV